MLLEERLFLLMKRGNGFQLFLKRVAAMRIIFAICDLIKPVIEPEASFKCVLTDSLEMLKRFAISW